MNELVNAGLCGLCGNPLTANDVIMGIISQYGVETGDLKSQAGGLCARCSGKDVYGTKWTITNEGSGGAVGRDAVNDHSIFYNSMLEKEKYAAGPTGSAVCSFCHKVDMGNMNFLKIQALTTNANYENIDVCGDCARKYGYL